MVDSDFYKNTFFMVIILAFHHQVYKIRHLVAMFTHGKLNIMVCLQKWPK